MASLRECKDRLMSPSHHHLHCRPGPRRLPWLRGSSSATAVGAEGQARSAELRARVLLRKLLPRPFVTSKVPGIAGARGSLMHASHYSTRAQADSRPEGTWKMWLSSELDTSKCLSDLRGQRGQFLAFWDSSENLPKKQERRTWSQHHCSLADTAAGKSDRPVPSSWLQELGPGLLVRTGETRAKPRMLPGL